MTIAPHFKLAFANGEADLRAAQRLRYDVFVNELGAAGPMVDHDNCYEVDQFDQNAHHLILRDLKRSADDQVVGVYRLMSSEQASATCGFVSAQEYDLAPLMSSGRKLLELGRSCLHREYRGGAAMFHLWQGLAAHIAATKTEILFGVASFHGTNVAQLAQPLGYLHHNYIAPEPLRPIAKGQTSFAMDLMPVEKIDRVAAVAQVPALIKAYLRLGGMVGQGAFVDRQFNTTDVCMVVDVDRMTPRQRAIYERSPG